MQTALNLAQTVPGLTCVFARANDELGTTRHKATPFRLKAVKMEEKAVLQKIKNKKIDCVHGTGAKNLRFMGS